MKPTTIDISAAVAPAPPDDFSMVNGLNGRRWQVVFAVVVVAFLTILARAGISGAKLEMALANRRLGAL